MEIFTLIGILVAAAIFARLAIKAKSVGSFRFQLSAFILIWAVAESLYVAQSLGLSGASNFDKLRLAFHFISMARFAVFVGTRSFKFFKAKPPSLPQAQVKPIPDGSDGKMSVVSFEDLVENSVTQTLFKILGPLVWQSIAFYFDPKALSKDPGAQPELLDRIFGKNHRVLEKVIADDLLSRVGVPIENRRGSDFRAFMRIAKARSVASAARPASANSSA